MKTIFALLFSFTCVCVQAQNNFSTEDYKHIKWEQPRKRPVIKPPFPSPVIADPTFITPDQATDNRWHLFAHSISGTHQYTSADGIRWKRTRCLVVKKALRPFIIREQDVYYLFYEKYEKLFPYASHLEMIKSRDLISWSKAVIILTPDNKYSRDGAPNGSVSNPCIVKITDGYRLYFSAGLVYLKDCGFSEPRYICYATSPAIDGPYRWAGKPLLEPDTTDPNRNAGAGAIKVFKTSNGYVGYENGIAVLKNKHSYSSISLLESNDGITWRKISSEAFLKPTLGWQRDYIYALDIKFYNGRFYLFYNARRGHSWAIGRECIGVITGELK